LKSPLIDFNHTAMALLIKMPLIEINHIQSTSTTARMNEDLMPLLQKTGNFQPFAPYRDHTYCILPYVWSNRTIPFRTPYWHITGADVPQRE
jgi:hypothetical protein